MAIQKTPLVYAWVRDLQLDDKYNYLLQDYNWYLNKGRPTTNNAERADGSRKLENFKGGVLIYQLIMHLENGIKSTILKHVCHKNHNPLDNRLENLVFGTPRQNSVTYGKGTGVNETHNGKWRAQAKLGDKYYSGTRRGTEKKALEDYAKMVKDFEELGILPQTLQERKPLPKYIHFTNRPKPYCIQKRVSGRNTYFGSYATLAEAIVARDKLIANNYTAE
jgi:hypothetical protein